MNFNSCDSLILDFITEMLLSHPGRRKMKRGKNTLNAKTNAWKHKLRLTQNETFVVFNNCTYLCFFTSTFYFRIDHEEYSILHWFFN